MIENNRSTIPLSGLLEIIFKSFAIEDEALKTLLTCLLENQSLGHTELYLSYFIKEKGLKISVDELKAKALNSKLLSHKDFASLLVIEGDKIFVRRHLVYEDQLAAKLAQISKQRSPSLYESLKSIDLEVKLDNQQKMALQKALSNDIFLLSGGPGTGKTTLLSSIIYLLIAFYLKAQKSIKIIIAAPTAKATIKLKEAFWDLTKRAGIDPEKVDQLQFLTIHKLLQFGYYTVNPRRTKHNLIVCDWLIVDESSMLSLEMMHGLLRATASGARIILSGDKNQLPAISEGAPFKALLDAASNLKQESFPVVELKKNYRQSSKLSDLTTKLQDCLRLGQKETNGGDTQLLDIFSSHYDASFSWQEKPQFLSDLLEVATLKAATLEKISDPKELLAIAQTEIILTFNRYGENGCQKINRQAIKKVQVDQKNQWLKNTIYHGLPFIVKKNDYQQNLSNGEIGVFFQQEGKLLAAIATTREELRILPATAIYDFEPAYAITVHESQGSEFEKVTLVLAQEGSPLNLFESLYTGLSRAKSSLKLLGSKQALSDCLSSFDARESSFKQRLEKYLTH